MSTKRTLARRQFLVLSAGTMASALLAACGATPTATPVPPTATKPPAAPTATTAPAAAAPTATKPPAAAAAATTAPAAPAVSKYKEAPALADLVKAGKLPPVDQRLPQNPVVIKPTNKIGKYGGTLNGTCMAPETTSDLQIGHVVGLWRFSDDLKTATMEASEGYKFSPDNKTCTITLRKGMKWSDGTPFSADDMMFYYEDWQFNKDLAPTLPTQWQPGGTPMKVTKVDDYTVQFDFAVPNPAFALVHYSGSPVEAWRNKKWFSPYHLKYNPNANTEAKAKGFDDWKARFLKLASWNYGAMEPNIPVLGPWMPVKVDTQRQYYDRNPYYHHVDSDGNQLPYIDKQVVEYTSNLDVTNLRAISGDISISTLDLLLVNMPVLKQGEKAGNYTVKLLYSERGADVAIAFNQAHKDPVLKQIFGDVRFRQAVSVAINRNEINELVFLGQATVRQATINEAASFFKKEWADNFAQYDPVLANKLLDQVGLDKKGADGVRLRPDGKPMAILLEYLPHEGPKQQSFELVVKHLAKVGLKVEATLRERAFLSTRLNASEHDASGWHVDRQLERAAYTYGSTQKLGPGGDSAITWAKPWRDWLITGGKAGQEPPQEAKDLFNAYAAWQQTVMGTPEYTAAAQKTYDLIAKNLWVIGIVGQGPLPAVIKNNLENVLPTNVTRKIWAGAANWFWLPHAPEQWFFTS